MQEIINESVYRFLNTATFYPETINSIRHRNLFQSNHTRVYIRRYPIPLRRWPPCLQIFLVGAQCIYHNSCVYFYIGGNSMVDSWCNNIINFVYHKCWLPKHSIIYFRVTLIDVLKGFLECTPIQRLGCSIHPIPRCWEIFPSRKSFYLSWYCTSYQYLSILPSTMESKEMHSLNPLHIVSTHLRKAIRIN